MSNKKTEPKKVKKLNVPPFTQDQIYWLNTMFSIPIRKEDNKQTMVWKAAQTDVVNTIQTYHDQMVIGGLVDPSSLERRIKRDD